jgi:hypothetical protein
MMVVMMVVMATPGGECGTDKHQSQQNTSEKLFHGKTLARSGRIITWTWPEAQPNQRVSQRRHERPARRKL